MCGVSARNGRWNRIAEKDMYNGGRVTDLLKVFFFFFNLFGCTEALLWHMASLVAA